MIIGSHFTKAGQPASGLTPVITIREVSAVSDEIVINGEPMSEVGDGFYKYDFTSYSNTKNYFIISDGGGTLPPGERYQVTSNQEDLSDEEIENLATAIWDESAIEHTNTGTTGEMLNQIHANSESIKTDTTSILDMVEIILKHQQNRTLIDKNAKTLTIFDDDGVTPHTVFSLKDEDGYPNIEKVFERQPI